ncbi:hypothetical protein FB565_005414 [Actinoplanes lutulentus]|uniref:Lipoprotein n=1 Tax=Actinoplanes lutulentus TaxID=1287878 RepID=A0A327YZL5_9ACTN|nr:hypothetical protein [Actinoplanes lutulentus]MBB2945656.1 hypothetical protein [Actinoplanes lutulentus]RAK27253.1 hypothetical protein B0I29_124143 [Actinoplanes lutulentus]
MRLFAFTVTLLALSLTACSGGETPEPASSSAAPPSAAGPAADAGSALAGLAALALDRRFAALYTWDTGDSQPRDVIAMVANDGSWRVDIPRGALGGTADVAIVRTAAGVHQCSLGVSSTCVLVADHGEKVPRKYDPKVQRLFRQWLPAFTDRHEALAVSAVQPLDGAEGTCYSVDSVAAGLDAPVDVGIYCYSADGLLTAARVNFGVLKLVKQVAAPAAVQLPGPVVTGTPLGMDAPPPVVVPSSVVAPG